MRRSLINSLLIGVVLAGVVYANRAPVVSNVQARQRAGTMLVDITYDVYDADGDTLTVSLQISDDGGQTWRIPARTFTEDSDVGSVILSGTGKQIVWDAGADSPDIYGTDFRPKVVADDGQGSGGELTVSLPGGAQMEFVWIEPGTFLMGSPESDELAGDNVKPQHEVMISQGFYLGKYEITQGQWEGVMGTTPWLNYVQANPNYPTVYISWNDVQSFIHALNEAVGDSLYRLPSEAEWEYACRAGTTTRWSFGDDESQLGDYAWYFDNNSSYDMKDVGSKLPNPWGLYDMHGNVWEWCQNWSDSYSSESQVDPMGPSMGFYRTMRGGGFYHAARNVPSALRSNSSPGISHGNVGARLLKMAEPAVLPNREPGSDQRLNRPPRARVATGEDTVVVAGSMVMLDGSGSRDLDGDPLTYRWAQVSGPRVTLSDTSAVRPMFIPTEPGRYIFSLAVDDAQTGSTPDEVAIIVTEVLQGTPRDTTVALPGGATMAMVWIEPGTFVMGSPSSEPGRNSDEGPQHEVTISRGFHLGRYEVTQGQWESMMGSNPSYNKGPNRPVEQISWNDVQGFIAKLNEMAGEEIYRLPTEAEWEYACRGGTTTRWSFGDDESQLGDYAWYDGNNSPSGTKEVGSKLPNLWGLYDMHGNVWEWCQDWHGRYSSGAQVDSKGPAAGPDRVIRGGHFNGPANSADRNLCSPDCYGNIIGVRLARQEPVSDQRPNRPPRAESGKDTVVVAGSMVVLDGSDSSDLDGDPLTYRWEQTSGPRVTLSDTSEVWPTFTPTEPGRYIFSLVVYDAQTGSTPDEVAITVTASLEESYRDTTVILSGGATMEFVWIEPGTFVIGSPSSEAGRYDDEGPQHEVTISQGFYLGKYEITQGQWEGVMGATPWSGQDYVQANSNHPAVYISWDDVQSFIHALNEAAGDSLYRLPSEAEWEYACRAGTTTRWSFGNVESQLGDYAWYADNASNAGLEYAPPVGTKLPNPWGLYDMHGNVWEWCQDWYDPYSSGSQVDPTGPSTGFLRVMRGGNFGNGARSVRSAYRVSYFPGDRDIGIDARLLRIR